MNLNFGINNVRTTEFGVGRDDDSNERFGFVAVDAEVQEALREMVVATWDAMQTQTDTPSRYEPSDKHASSEYLHLPLNDELATRMRELHEANNLPADATALSETASLFCYFARMTDGKGRRLTSLRRATQFKGLLKSRLIRLTTNALKLVEDRVFKLDSDFDLLIDSKRVHILRPSGFEFAGRLQTAILGAVPKNVTAVQADLGFVEFAGIQDYASEHPRAARYLASIRAQMEAKNIDKNALKKLCRDNGVEVKESKGKITIPEEHVMDFLEVLDRRRYELELVKGSPERFKAASRRKIDSPGA